jgi:hypothetical protein
MQNYPIRQLGEPRISNPMLALNTTKSALVICDKKRFETHEGVKVIYRFPNQEDDMPFAQSIVNTKNLIYIKDLSTEHIVIKEGVSVDDLYHMLNHVSAVTVLLNTCDKTIRFIKKLKTFLRESYPYMALPYIGQVCSSERLFKNTKVAITLYNLEDVIVNYTSSPIDGVALCIELDDAEHIEQNTEPMYSEYYVFSEKKEGIFHLDGEHIFNIKMRLESYIEKTYAKYMDKSSSKKTAKVSNEIKRTSDKTVYAEYFKEVLHELKEEKMVVEHSYVPQAKTVFSAEIDDVEVPVESNLLHAATHKVAIPKAVGLEKDVPLYATGGTLLCATGGTVQKVRTTKLDYDDLVVSTFKKSKAKHAKVIEKKLEDL